MKKYLIFLIIFIFSFSGCSAYYETVRANIEAKKEVSLAMIDLKGKELEKDRREIELEKIRENRKNETGGDLLVNIEAVEGNRSGIPNIKIYKQDIYKPPEKETKSTIPNYLSSFEDIKPSPVENKIYSFLEGITRIGEIAAIGLSVKEVVEEIKPNISNSYNRNKSDTTRDSYNPNNSTYTEDNSRNPNVKIDTDTDNSTYTEDNSTYTEDNSTYTEDNSVNN